MSERELDVIRISLFDTRPLSRGREARLVIPSGPHAGEHEVTIEGADRRHLYLTPLLMRGKPVAVAAGTTVTLVVSAMEGRCEFATVVAQPDRQDPEVLLLVLPPEAQRLQRRRHLRVGAELPISVARLPATNEPLAALRFLDGRTKNLSEGGLSLIVPGLKLEPGDLVSISMLLPGARHKLRATCEVLRADQSSEIRALRFVDLDERMQAEFKAFIELRRRQVRSRGPAKLVWRLGDQSRE